MVRPRGTCPVCGRDVSLRKDGSIGRHGTKEPFVWPPEMCSGWGEPAKEQP